MEIVEVLNANKKKEFIENCDYVFPIGILKRTNSSEIITKIINNAIFLGAYENHQICGYCAFYANDFATKTAYVTMIGVLPEFQGKGVGSKLIDNCIEKCKLLNMEKIRLEVLNSNEKAITFYKIKGFLFERPLSNETSYYIRHIDNITNVININKTGKPGDAQVEISRI